MKKNNITKTSWFKLWYLNVIFGLWIIIGLIVIMFHAIQNIDLSISAHYLVGIPGYALAGEMLSIVGFKGWKHLRLAARNLKGASHE